MGISMWMSMDISMWMSMDVSMWVSMDISIRRWIGADNSPESLSAVIRRFRDGLQDYGDYVSKPFDQPELTLKTETDGTRFSLFSEHAKTDEALSIIKSVG
jgi:hypothetical protein